LVGPGKGPGLAVAVGASRASNRPGGDHPRRPAGEGRAPRGAGLKKNKKTKKGPGRGERPGGRRGELEDFRLVAGGNGKGFNGPSRPGTPSAIRGTGGAAEGGAARSGGGRGVQAAFCRTQGVSFPAGTPGGSSSGGERARDTGGRVPAGSGRGAEGFPGRDGGLGSFDGQRESDLRECMGPAQAGRGLDGGGNAKHK